MTLGANIRKEHAEVKGGSSKQCLVEMLII